MSHAKISWVKQKTGATSSDPNWEDRFDVSGCFLFDAAVEVSL
nr:hypothetical protein SEVIR_1G223550v2 [Setaria viridis]